MTSLLPIPSMTSMEHTRLVFSFSVSEFFFLPFTSVSLFLCFLLLSFFFSIFLSLFIYFFLSIFIYFFLSLFIYLFLSIFISFFLSCFLSFYLSFILSIFLSFFLTNFSHSFIFSHLFFLGFFRGLPEFFHYPYYVPCDTEVLNRL